MNWKIYQNEYFTIRYPNNWSFEKYNQNLYKGHTLFQDLDSNLKVSGEIKIVTPQQIKGRVWPDFSIQNFFDPKNNFWEVGENIGGGPGFSYQTPSKVLIAGYDSMFQSTHPSKSGYEGSSTDYVTNYYYMPINNSTKEIIEIYFIYDKKYLRLTRY